MPISLDSWSSKYKIGYIINLVRNQLKKTDFIRNIEKIMKKLGNSKYENIEYENIKVNTLEAMLNFDDPEGNLKLAGLYFVIDIVHYKYQYNNPKVEIIDSFSNICRFTEFEIQLVSEAWMLENGYPPSEKSIEFYKKVPSYFRIYFLQQILYTNNFDLAYDFYSNFQNNFSIGEKYPEEGKTIVQCLTASYHLNEAIEFIRQYCLSDYTCNSNDQNYYKTLYNDYFLEMKKVAALTYVDLQNGDFSPEEAKIIADYIEFTEPTQYLPRNDFLSKYKKQINSQNQH